jgi:8-oxo-dGTP pyrophosphatase MutT (NUDIX family)
MGGDAHESREELLNVYDAEGAVIGVRPRPEAKASGLPVGAVNALVINVRGEVLLQRRPQSKENGGLWDKSVGGHVAAGEDFDAAIVRETAEELCAGDARGVILAPPGELAAVAARTDLARTIVLGRVALHLGVRDVRRLPGGGWRNVLYHVAAYHGRTEIGAAGLRPEAREIDELRYFSFAQIDGLLLGGELAPNLGLVWLAQAHALLRLVRPC